MTGSLVVDDAGTAVWTATFRNPGRKNAMTWDMYAQLVELCRRITTAPIGNGPRVLVLRGDGDAFVAGTDIGQFEDFRTGADGVEYERRVTAVLEALLAVPIPVIAAVSGPAVGGGLAIAAASDIVIADDSAVFGVPIARTLGNTLAPLSTALLLRKWGAARTNTMLLGARLLSAADAGTSGFAAAVVLQGELDGTVAEWSQRIAGFAPVTLRALKSTIASVQDVPAPDSADREIAEAYASTDFHEGVAAFVGGRRPVWNGH